MIHNDPYKSPDANVQEEDQQYNIHNARVRKMTLGQKLIIYAVFLHIISFALRIAIGPIFIVIFPFALVLSLIGLFKIFSARKTHVAVRIFLFVLQFVPLLNIVVLLNVYGQSIKSLRVAKYQEGFIEAKRHVGNA